MFSINNNTSRSFFYAKCIFWRNTLTLCATILHISHPLFRLSLGTKIVSSLSAFLIILCISRRISPFSVRAYGPGQLSARHPVFRHSLRKCPPRGLRRARYILLPLAHDRDAPSSYANLSQISHGISLEIHNRRPLRTPAVPLSRRPPEARGKKPMIRKK